MAKIRVDKVVDGNIVFHEHGPEDLTGVILKSPTAIESNLITIPNATYKGLVIKGASGQSANLQEWKNSSGTVLGFIDKDGTLHGTRGTTASAVENLFICGAGNGTYSGTGVNIAIGIGAFNKLTDGTNNFGLGYLAGSKITTGSYNTLVGVSSAYNTSAGSTGNTVFGSNSFISGSGNFNTIVGYSCANSAGASNVVVGIQGMVNGSGSNNTILGTNAGYSSSSGSYNIFLGSDAGFRQTTNNYRLIIDSIQRTSAAEELTNSILYGVMAVTPTSQTLRINAKITADASTVPLTILGSVSQISNLTEWQNSSGTVLISINKDGNFGVGTNNPIGNIGGKTIQLQSSTTYTQFYNISTHASSGGFFTLSGDVGKLEFGTFGSTNPLGNLFGVTRPNNSFMYTYSGAKLGIGTLGTNDLYFGTNNTKRVTIDSNGLFTIGLTALTGRFNVNGSSDIIQSIIRGHSSQTANLTEWQNSSGTVLAYVEKAGLIKSSGRKQVVSVKSTNYTLTTNDEVVVFTATATATLPSATGSGQTYRIKSRKGSGATVTVDANGSQTIDGSLVAYVTDGNSITIIDSASGVWEII